MGAGEEILGVVDEMRLRGVEDTKGSAQVGRGEDPRVVLERRARGGPGGS